MCMYRIIELKPHARPHQDGAVKGPVLHPQGSLCWEASPEGLTRDTVTKTINLKIAHGFVCSCPKVTERKARFLGLGFCHGSSLYVTQISRQEQFRFFYTDTQTYSNFWVIPCCRLQREMIKKAENSKNNVVIQYLDSGTTSLCHTRFLGQWRQHLSCNL
jgi:hypothetical protein